ncbi:Cytochrome P450 [Cordyceps fumosorosea ARSEF 2679]|uniref:Cytochrome P450 n=1 Tax=Cordyceps fumosorosea (strain ARSEF 2679) TaxID=1081104 RepID=A0A168D5P9_CORFA|nr:Cytochrome P450 [Cordyceps fumosorosea ARSEF 2679]OAA72201.1 Cytochrome P450 [Cordyceps fumosorosea ARSEF 2679]
MPRRRVAPIYARKFVQTNAHVRAIMREMIHHRMLPLFQMTSQCATQAIDILPVLQSYTIDFTVAFVFGLSRGTNFMLNADARDEWLEAYTQSYPADSMFWLQECAAVTKFAQRLGLGGWLLPEGHEAARIFLDEWALGKMRQADYALSLNEGVESKFESGDFPILYDVVKAGLAKSADRDPCFTPDAQEELQLASECFDHIVAARDTFGISFTYILYKISHHPSTQEELHKELLSINSPVLDTASSDRVLPEAPELANLPLLNAVIHEGLRLRNNTPDAEPRLTPRREGGSRIGSLYALPAGIRVGAYGWSLHRDEAVFPDASAWDPRRWMGVDGKNSNPNRYLYAFGHGSRSCVGQQLAMELMRYAVAAIYTNYRTSVADEREYPGDDGFVGGDCREKLHIRFERICDDAQAAI